MDNYINVAIHFREDRKEDNIFPSNMPLNDSQYKILNLIRRNPEYTIKDLVKESKLSDGYVREILTYLKEKKYIERTGSNKKGYWIVLDK